MYDTDNNEITSLDDLCMCMSKPASLNSRIISLVLKTYKNSPVKAAKTAEIWNYFSSESDGFVARHRNTATDGIVMATGFDNKGDICVTYDKSLDDAFRQIDRVFNGIVLLREFKVFVPNHGVVDRAAVVYTGTPQAAKEYVRRHPARVLASAF